MIEVQTIGAQGVKNLKLAPGAQLKLQAGQSLVLAQDGVVAERRGADMVLTVTGADGQPQQIVVLGFFAADMAVQVLLQEPGEPVRVFSPQSTDVPQANPNAAQAPTPPVQSQSTATVMASEVSTDLRINDTRAQADLVTLPTSLSVVAETAPEKLALPSALLEITDTPAQPERAVEVTPLAPKQATLVLPQSGLLHDGLTAINMTSANAVFSGTGDPLTSVMLMVSDTAGKTLNLQVEVDAQGTWQQGLSLAQWASFSGRVSVQAQSQSQTGIRGAASETQFLYVDATAPNTPTLAWPAGVVTTSVSGQKAVNLAVLARAKDSANTDGLFSGTTEPLSTVTLSLSTTQGALKFTTQVGANGAWQWKPSAQEASELIQTLGGGDLTVTAMATDALGNTSETRQLSGLFDVTSPALTLGEWPAASFTLDGVRVFNRQSVSQNTVFTGTAEASGSVSVQLKDAAGRIATSGPFKVPADTTAWSVTFTPQQILSLSDGPLTVTVTAVDAAQNSTTSSMLAELHKNQPTGLTSLALATGSDSINGVDSATSTDRITNVEKPTLQLKTTGVQKVVLWVDTDQDGVVDAAENASRIELTSDANGDLAVPLNSTLSQGDHTYAAAVIDKWGNLSNPSQLTFTVDTQAESLTFDTVGTDNKITDAQFSEGVTLSGQAEAGAWVKVTVMQGAVYKTYDALSQSNTSGVGTWRVADFGKGLGLTDGTWTIAVAQTDLAGNQQNLATRSITARVNALAGIDSVALTDSTNSGLKTDNITSDKKPMFTGTGPTGTTGLDVVVYQNNQEIGRTALGTNGQFSWTPSSDLAQGLNNLVFKVADPATGSVSAKALTYEVVIDSQALAPDIDLVMGDDFVNSTEFAAGIEIKGKVEVGATIKLKLTTASLEMSVDAADIQYTDVEATGSVTAHRTWVYKLSSSTAALIGNATVIVSATQTDLAGNDSALLPNSTGVGKRTFTINQFALEVPGPLDLYSGNGSTDLFGDDTGQSNTDNRTQKTTLRLSTTADQSGRTVHVFDDVNKDGAFTAGTDVLLATETAGADKVAQLTVTLTSGEHQLRAWVEGVGGQKSDPGAALLVNVDTQADKVSALQVAGDDRINADEAGNTPTNVPAVLGEGEVGALVVLKFYDSNNVEKLVLGGGSTPIRVLANATAATGGRWSVSLTAANIAALGGDGNYTVKAVQTDVAGNVSEVQTLSFKIDTQAPRVPTSSELVIAETENNKGPWYDQNGVTWGDLYTFNAVTGKNEARTITVHVALPAGGAMAVGDAVALTWGSHTVRHTVTQNDLNLGYAAVALLGSDLEQQGARLALNVTAKLIDAAGNASDSFTVLSGISVPLSAPAPVFSLPQAQQNTANPIDNTWYSNRGVGAATNDLKSLKFEGTAEKGKSIQIGYFDANGVWQTLDTATADIETGIFSREPLLDAYLSNGQVHTLLVRIASGASTYSYSEGLKVQLDTTPPSAPTVSQTNSTLAGDGFVNASERNGVTLSGQAEAWATVSVQLVNTTLNVDGAVMQVRADASGHWSRTLGIVDWGRVGEGRINVLVWQTDLAGNSSLTTLPNGQGLGGRIELTGITYDASVNAPTLTAVAGNNYINSSEMGTQQASQNTTLTGSGEAGGVVTLTLTGANGTLSFNNIQVGSDGVWTQDLSRSQLLALVPPAGEGVVSVSLSQRDAAGNTSTTLIRSFVVDNAVAAPTLDANVAGNDAINALEKSLGVTLAGQGEPDAKVTITLTDSAGSSPVVKSFTTTVGSNGRYSRTLSATELDGLAEGTLQVTVQQTDAAGNASASTTRALTLQATPLVGEVTVTTLSGDNRVSLGEQTAASSEAPITLQGTASVGNSMHVTLQGTVGQLSFTPTLTNGAWSVALTKTNFETLGAGAVQVQAWAQDAAGKSTNITSSSLVLETAEPSPTFDTVATDGLLNKAELQAAEGVVLSGKGVAGHVVRIELTGSKANSKIVYTVTVDNDGKWRTAGLTTTEATVLGEGAVAVKVWQKTANNVADSDPYLASLPLSAAFTIDTVAPALPLVSSDDATAATLYNTVTGALSNGVQLAEANQGVLLAIPVRVDGSTLRLSAGDKITVKWGDALQEVIFQQDDITRLGNSSIHTLTVLPATIAKQGSGTVSVSVAFTDKAGNSTGEFFTLINALTVTAPPPVPLLDTVDGDGYINTADFDRLGLSGTVAIGGSANSADGSITVVLSGAAGSRTYTGVNITTSNTWQVNLTAADLNALGEGAIGIKAKFVRVSDQAASSEVAGSFSFDKSLPNAPSAANQSRADEVNAVSVLSGGLIRINTAVTEAAQSVPVSVALPANAKAGDQVTLIWGVDSAQVTSLVSTADLDAGYVTVWVPPEIMTAVGDSNVLTVKAYFTDASGNQGDTRDIWTGKVDALPEPASLSPLTFGEWLNTAEAQANGGWAISGTRLVGSSVQLTLTGTKLNELGEKVQIVKSIAADTNASTGLNWTTALTEQDAIDLGDGKVNISVVQFDNSVVVGDTKGNPSAATMGVFQIDRTPPASPVVDTPTATLTYAQTQSPQSFSGKAELGASVKVRFVRGSGNSISTVTKEVTADATTGVWTTQLEAKDFATLSANNTSGPVSITAIQIDVAENESAPSTAQTFSYSTQVMAAPAFSTVTGLAADGSDLLINLADVNYSLSKPLELKGTATKGFNVHLTITVGGVRSTFDAVANGGADLNTGEWTLLLTEAQFNALGQGTASVKATTQQLDPANQAVLNESVETVLTLGASTSFSIDTVAPSFVATQVLGTGRNGNAKAGDWIEWVISANEALTVTGQPSLVMTGFGATGQETRTATYDATASAARGNRVMVLRYQVQNNEVAAAGKLAVQGALVKGNGVSIKDSAGNDAELTLVIPDAHTVQVDTTPPSAPSLGSVAAVQPGTPGDSWINLAEATATVAVVVNLAGTGVQLGDTLQLLWIQVPNPSDRSQDVVPSTPYSVVVTSLSSQTVNVPSSVIGAWTGQSAIRVQLVDASGNVSGYNSTAMNDLLVNVDTQAPGGLTFNDWMSDNKISQSEINAIQSLTGTGAEPTGTVQARHVQTVNNVTTTTYLVSSDITVDDKGVWTLSQDKMQSLMSSAVDGDFLIEVRQLDAHGNPGAWLSTNYYKDTTPPSTPAKPVVALVADGWINASDAKNLVVEVSLAGTNAQVGDKVRLYGLPRAITASNTSVTTPYTIELTDEMWRNGKVSFAIPESDLKQATDAAPRTGLQLSAEIEDRGGNISTRSEAVVTGLDTNIATPSLDAVGLLAPGGVTAAAVTQDQLFQGRGIEAGVTELRIRITGSTGKVVALVPTVQADGSFTASLAASDFKTLGAGTYTYSVQQTDTANNTSQAATGSFQVELATPEPALNDFAGDNVVGTSGGQSEWTTAQSLSGTASYGPGAKVLIEVWLKDGSAAVISGLEASVAVSGLWSLPITAGHFSTLIAAAGQSSFEAYFKVKASKGEGLAASESSTVTQTFLMSTATPTVSPTVTRFDASGDGANNDGLQISFNEAVRVLDLSSLASNVFTTAKTWGTGARIEAVNPSTFNGVQFAQTFKIYLGSGATLTSSDVVGVTAANIVNVGGNTAAMAQSFTVPSLVIPDRPSPPVAISSDNFINGVDKVSGAGTDVTFTFKNSSNSAVSAQAGDRLDLLLNGSVVTSNTFAATATSHTFNISASTWGADGTYQVSAQLTRASMGGTSLISSPKTLILDSVVQQGINTASLISDAGADGLVGVNDVVRLQFNESLSLSTLNSVFGTGANATAVGAVNGKSAVWDVKLGTGVTAASLFDTPITVSTVTDVAGNSNILQGTISSQIYATPGTPRIASVSSDNVLNSAEKGTELIRVYVDNLTNQDLVTLSLDGKLVSNTPVSRTTGVGGYVEFAVSAANWGADGEKHLSANVQRGAGPVLSSANRSVYVAADGKHWSSNNLVWFDPDTLVTGNLGTWNASAGGSVGTLKGVNLPVLVTDSVTGHQSVNFATYGTTAANKPYYTFTDPNSLLPAGRNSLTVIGATYQATQDTNLNVFLAYGQSNGSSPTKNMAIQLGVDNRMIPWYSTLPQRLTIDVANVYPYGADASGTTGNWLVAQYETYSSNTQYKISANGQLSGQGLLNNSAGVGYVDFGAPNYRVLGSAVSGHATNLVMGDQILVSGTLGAAQAGEINAYVAWKYASVGSQIILRSDNVYNLVTSANQSPLIDDRLDLTSRESIDTVTVAGADYVQTGQGNDTVYVKDLTFRTLDGGSDRDTWALDTAYAGYSNIVLADFVSNARGMGTDTAANTRVNAAGFHKLQGFEVIDTSRSTARQVLTLVADDVNQLSETNTLEIKLGSNDVLLTTGLGALQHGVFKVNGSWYDSFYTATTTDNQVLKVYANGGDQETLLSTAQWNTSETLLSLGLDHAMIIGSVNKGDFAITRLDTGNAVTDWAVTPFNQRQGLQFSSSTAWSAPLKITYSPTNSNTQLRDEVGRGFASTVWLVGTGGDDTDTTLNGETTYRLNADKRLSTDEQNKGVILVAGSGADQLTGGLGADVLIGGLGADTMTGGAGADTFRYVNEVAGSGADGNLGGLVGDVITDFNFGVKATSVNGSTTYAAAADEADRLDFRDFFDVTFTGNATTDAASLINNGYLGINKLNKNGKTVWEFTADRDGKDAQGSNTTAVLLSIEGIDLTGSDSSITGSETTSELLRKMLEEGRMLMT